MGLRLLGAVRMGLGRLVELAGSELLEPGSRGLVRWTALVGSVAVQAVEAVLVVRLE